MIQEFLNNQFIKTADDANFDKLKKASLDVVKKISKDKGKIAAYTLVAFDPAISPDNICIVEVKQLIINNWNTFVTNCIDTPVTFIRAVILEALGIISKEASTASLIWFTARNVIKYYDLGREKDILSSFLLALGNKIESEVEENWTFSPDSIIEVPEITAAKIDNSELETQLKLAVFHTSWGGENTATPNQADQTWSTFFVTRTSKVITDTVNKVLKKQANEIRSNQIEFVRQNGLLQMRTQLLWWKEAGYSLSLKKSYKDLKEGILQVALALDYSHFVPDMYPKSVDYFLKETHNCLIASGEKKAKISDILKSVESSKSDLLNILPEYEVDGNRVLLINFLRGLIYGKFTPKQFKSSLGIADSTELTYTDFTIWLFHDLHSLKLSSIK
jgi:hypothetical protein